MDVEYITDSQGRRGTKKPDFIAKVPAHERGIFSHYTVIGVAWRRDDGSIFFQPYGTQIIDKPITLFTNDEW